MKARPPAPSPGGPDNGNNGGGGDGRRGPGEPGSGGRFHKRLGPVNFAENLAAARKAVRANLTVVMLFTVATNVLVLAIPVYLFQISDRVLTSRSLDTLVMLTAVIVGAVLLQSILDAIRRFILMRTAVEVAVQLGAPILSAAARASLNGSRPRVPDLGRPAAAPLVPRLRHACSRSSMHRWRRCSFLRFFWFIRISASLS